MIPVPLSENKNYQLIEMVQSRRVSHRRCDFITFNETFHHDSDFAEKNLHLFSIQITTFPKTMNFINSMV